MLVVSFPHWWTRWCWAPLLQNQVRGSTCPPTEAPFAIPETHTRCDSFCSCWPACLVIPTDNIATTYCQRWLDVDTVLHPARLDPSSQLPLNLWWKSIPWKESPRVHPSKHLKGRLRERIGDYHFLLNLKGRSNVRHNFCLILAEGP